MYIFLTLSSLCKACKYLTTHLICVLKLISYLNQMVFTQSTGEKLQIGPWVHSDFFEIVPFRSVLKRGPSARSFRLRCFFSTVPFLFRSVCSQLKNRPSRSWCSQSKNGSMPVPFLVKNVSIPYSLKRGCSICKFTKKIIHFQNQYFNNIKKILLVHPQQFCSFIEKNPLK